MPAALMRELLSIEKAFGRVRKTKWEARSLDLDLIDYGGLVTDAEHLMLPHPWMHERAFVLRPLADIAPGWRHPDTGLERFAVAANGWGGGRHAARFRLIRAGIALVFAGAAR